MWNRNLISSLCSRNMFSHAYVANELLLPLQDGVIYANEGSVSLIDTKLGKKDGARKASSNFQLHERQFAFEEEILQKSTINFQTKVNTNYFHL